MATSPEVAPDERHQRRKEIARRSYEKHKAKRLAQNRAFQKANPGKVREYAHRWREKNKEKALAYGHQYRRDNPEKVKQSVRNYQKAHPERVLWAGAKDRARLKGLPFEITPEDILECIEGVGPTCPITGEPFKKGKGKSCPQSMSLDRVIPALGYVRGNIRIISVRANTIKQDCTDPWIFRRVAEYLERYGHKGSK